MRVVIRAVAWTLAAVAVAAAGGAWLRSAPELDAGDATDVALGAMASIGRDADLVGTVRRGTHQPRNGGAPVDAWLLTVAVDDETVDLRVPLDAGQVVYVDDLTADETGRVLTEGEFSRLGAYRDEAVLDRWVLRNGVGSAGALLISGVSIGLGRASDHVVAHRSAGELP